jgi:hypothetical protein
MTWKKLNPEEKETIFLSSSSDSTHLAADLKTVVDRMVENKDADNASAAKQLLFNINATNGFIKIVWWNNDTSETIGDWMYEINLATLWEAHDAFNFDKVCYNAMYDFTEDNMISEEGDSLYDIFRITELSEIEELLI